MSHAPGGWKGVVHYFDKSEPDKVGSAVVNNVVVVDDVLGLSGPDRVAFQFPIDAFDITNLVAARAIVEQRVECAVVWDVAAWAGGLV